MLDLHYCVNFSSFKHILSYLNLRESHQKNAQLMPNNESKTIDFLVRLFSLFEEFLKNNLSGKKHTI
jgi:hypothetical protein